MGTASESEQRSSGEEKMPTLEEANARKMQIEESMRALDYYKEQNEEALRQALKKDEAVKKHTKATSKDAIKVRAPRSRSASTTAAAPRGRTRRSAPLRLRAWC